MTFQRQALAPAVGAEARPDRVVGVSVAITCLLLPAARVFQLQYTAPGRSDGMGRVAFCAPLHSALGHHRIRHHVVTSPMSGCVRADNLFRR